MSRDEMENIREFIEEFDILEDPRAENLLIMPEPYECAEVEEEGDEYYND
jgi:hypothetical protein